MAELSDSDIQHLGRLARLNVSAEESARYAEQLTSVVHYVDQLASVSIEHVEARTGVTGLRNVLANDEAGSDFFEHETALNAAPRRDGEFIEVRAVMGGEVEVS